MDKRIVLTRSGKRYRSGIVVYVDEVLGDVLGTPLDSSPVLAVTDRALNGWSVLFRYRIIHDSAVELECHVSRRVVHPPPALAMLLTSLLGVTRGTVGGIWIGWDQ